MSVVCQAFWTLGWWERNTSWRESASPQWKLLFLGCCSKEILVLFCEVKIKAKPQTIKKNNNHRPKSPLVYPTIFPLISKKLYGQRGFLHFALPNSIAIICMFSWNCLGKVYMLYIWVQYNVYPKTQEIKFG